MLVEVLHLLTTPIPWAHRRRGYLRESVLLLSRSRRCRAAWAGHLAESRAAVIAACAGLERRRVAVVLGSGLLQDVPLAHLAARFDAVRLVDAVHLWPARRQARAYPNVTLVTADLIPGRDGADSLAALCGSSDVDFVVSANVLSQLPILPLDRPGFVPPDLGARIVAGHLDGLARLAARVCLLTDVEQVEQDRDGRVTDRIDLLHGIGLGTPDRTWIWDLAPFGEAARHLRQQHRVQAFLDWRGP
ncbi:hypothetical protein [Methylobacterium sp. J-068]|uniref:hypothetical protein n=1 Tax=Methylobacterium sp. J-068 TaxID=2836649 RepID=UPI001FB89377|nr:hypothetical protein [Methylobacterium sp. J-068]MCJ2034406.1 hypothetical protein [Methylobacterium sp. J-068]